MTATTRPTLLVVDDEPGILAVIERFGETQGFNVIAHAGGNGILAQLPALKADVALVDLRMPDVTGLDVLRAIQESDPSCQVILMTAHATVDSAIEAVKLGALDYLSKPFDFERLADLFTTVRKSLERRQVMFAADSELASRFEFCGLIGRSPAMQELFDKIRRLAPHLRTALVTGETGTGKELVARALHKLGSRRERRFATINCSAVVETLFESELFGHVRGAFTGANDAKAGILELADGGTVFLDEIGELPTAMQAKLLRAVEYGEVQRVGSAEAKRVDLRIIAATNRDLLHEARIGRFRADLYYRLDVVELQLPPLRERREDIPYLTAAFVKEFGKSFGKPVVGISPGAERLLQEAAWPGNIRELRNVLERACMLSEGRMLTERDLTTALGSTRRPVTVAVARPLPMEGMPSPVPELAREQLQQVLVDVHGNKAAAARLLGVSRRALYRRLDSFGLR